MDKLERIKTIKEELAKLEAEDYIVKSHGIIKYDKEDYKVVELEKG